MALTFLVGYTLTLSLVSLISLAFDDIGTLS